MSSPAVASRRWADEDGEGSPIQLIVSTDVDFVPADSSASGEVTTPSVPSARAESTRYNYSKPQAPLVVSPYSVNVTGLDWGTVNEDDIARFFARRGCPATKLSLNKKRGVAILEFKSDLNKENALQLSGELMGRRNIIVTPNKPPPGSFNKAPTAYNNQHRREQQQQQQNNSGWHSVGPVKPTVKPERAEKIPTAPAEEVDTSMRPKLELKPRSIPLNENLETSPSSIKERHDPFNGAKPRTEVIVPTPPATVVTAPAPIVTALAPVSPKITPVEEVVAVEPVTGAARAYSAKDRHDQRVASSNAKQEVIQRKEKAKKTKQAKVVVNRFAALNGGDSSSSESE